VLVLQSVGALGVAIGGTSTVHQVGAAAALAAALVVAFGRVEKAAYVVVGWFLIAALSQTFGGLEPFGYLAVGAHAIRYGVALAIVMPEHAFRILRVGTSLTFAVHGLEAIGLHPQFVEYILHTAGLVGLPLSEIATRYVLQMIGVVDLVVAGSLLLPRPRPITAGYMAIWGTITAFARTVYAGPAGLPETLIRASHAGGPLALLLSWRPDLGRRPSAPPTSPPPAD
jgi:hypothetical protein